MPALVVDHLTKDFGGGKGVFDLSFAVEPGEVFGFLGPNGAGKTTTIRHLMGFLRPQAGRSAVGGFDCWTRSKDVRRTVGYLPGEIAFPPEMTGLQLVRYLADMRGLKNTGKAAALADRLDLDLSGDLKRMSKGMKQKTGIVCALIHDPAVLILDEPTSGLDPLMQSAFVGLIREERASGKSILLSSHLFGEVENTCDRIGIIRNGRMAATVDPRELKHAGRKSYKIGFLEADDFASMARETFAFSETDPALLQVVIDIEDADINRLLAALAVRRVKFVSEVKHGLEEHFMRFYNGGDGDVE